LTLGASLILINLSYLWLGIFRTIFVIAFVINTIYFKGEKFFNSKDLEDDNIKWGGSSIALIAVILFFSFGGRNLPPVTLDNDVIKMGGQFGRIVYISDIQSLDTVSVYPRLGFSKSGLASSSILVGSFDLQNEKMKARLCLYKNNPPYIMMRMKDNSLFILNFKESDKTVEFFNKIKEVQNK